METILVILVSEFYPPNYYIVQHQHARFNFQNIRDLH